MSLLAARDLALAFGPRTLFEVETADARLQLAFRHRSRRWTIEGVEAHKAA